MALKLLVHRKATIGDDGKMLAQCCKECLFKEIVAGDYPELRTAEGIHAQRRDLQLPHPHADSTHLIWFLVRF
ncbi:hypothetical protein P5673_000946 [Acropora cervicornis]|uniref:Uncharacterized protein n=1 Tax=Acropora cervicornis TaxID=6130 RepID=A0AAD9VG42_ACRCE|nr:hypothetical protein P5673_000946 [Acropora cervicornis]